MSDELRKTVAAQGGEQVTHTAESLAALSDAQLTAIVGRLVMKWCAEFDPKTFRFRFRFHDGGEQSSAPWFPTKDCNDALEAIKRVRGDGVVTIEIGELTVNQTTVTITTDPAAPGGGLTLGAATNTSTPRAICIAAVLAAQEKER